MPAIPLPKQERYDVTLLALMDTITRSLMERSKPLSRRHNQLSALLERIKAADETYHGYLPDEFQAEAERILEEIEVRIVNLNKEES